jgi:hypothetical protein
MPLLVGIVVSPTLNTAFPIIRFSNEDLPVRIGPTMQMGNIYPFICFSFETPSEFRVSRLLITYISLKAVFCIFAVITLV